MAGLPACPYGSGMTGGSRGRARALVLVLVVLLGLVAAPSGAAPHVAKAEPPRPVVTKVDRTTGPVAGGTRVVVRGRHLSGATKVVFGRVNGTIVDVRSDRKLIALTPRHAPGTFKVRVVTKGGKSRPGTTFTFVAPPQTDPPPAPTEGVVDQVVCPATGYCVVEGSGSCTPTGVSVGPFLDVPWLMVLGLVVALPLLTAAVVGVFARSRLPLVARLD